jgi:competence protein ComFC
MGLLDFIFPKRCVICKTYGKYLCDSCFTNISFDSKSLCLICDTPSYNGLTHPKCKTKYSIDGCFSALSYNKTIQKLMFNFKYKPYLIDLRDVLGDLFFESIIQNESFNNQFKNGKWVLVPIPLFYSKLRRRGYNQAEILAYNLGKRLKMPVINILQRTKNTTTQVGKSDIERKLNIKGAFKITKQYPSILNHKSIILVDDVVTTGSTLKEAAKILKYKGAKRIIGLTLARGH